VLVGVADGKPGSRFNAAVTSDQDLDLQLAARAAQKWKWFQVT
jgi:hypothetical protein